MFDFFKKKKDPESPVEDKTAELDAPETTPAEEESAKPAAQSTPQTAVEEKQPEAKKPSWAQRLKAGLSKTRQNLGGQISSLFSGGKIDDDTYEELEAILLTSDVGVAATQKLLDNLKARVKKERLEDTTALKAALKTELHTILAPLEVSLDTSAHTPFVIMMAGAS